MAAFRNNAIQYRSAEECRFLDVLENDLYEFCKTSTPDAVLILPPLNPRYRFLTHKFVEERVPGLRTVSIGEGTGRRTAVYISQKRTSILVKVMERCQRSSAGEEEQKTPQRAGYGLPGQVRGRGRGRGRGFVGRQPDGDTPSSENRSSGGTVVPRSRGRGRKKPDQVLYVPRALRGPSEPRANESKIVEDPSETKNSSEQECKVLQSTASTGKGSSMDELTDRQQVSKSGDQKCVDKQLQGKDCMGNDQQFPCLDATSSDGNDEGTAGGVDTECTTFTGQDAIQRKNNTVVELEINEMESDHTDSKGGSDNTKCEESDSSQRNIITSEEVSKDQEYFEEYPSSSDDHRHKPQECYSSDVQVKCAEDNSMVSHINDSCNHENSCLSFGDNNCLSVSVDHPNSTLHNSDSTGVKVPATAGDRENSDSVDISGGKVGLGMTSDIKDIESPVTHSEQEMIIDSVVSEKEHSSRSYGKEEISKDKLSVEQVSDDNSSETRAVGESKCTESQTSEKTKKRKTRRADEKESRKKSKLKEDKKKKMKGKKSSKEENTKALDGLPKAAKHIEIQSEEGTASNSKGHTGSKSVHRASNEESGEGSDDWDANFNDDGECLNPELLEQLHITTGIDKPIVQKSCHDYYNWTPAEVEVDEPEYEHIVEIYGFSSELKTQDLTMAFSSFREAGFDIKWVDGSHALGVFTSKIAANQAINLCSSPLLKVRPLSQGIPESKQKARTCLEFLQPCKERPKTSKIAANRMISGALGIQSKMSREERQKEREKLKEAKEQKRKKQQQKAEAWGD